MKTVDISELIGKRIVDIRGLEAGSESVHIYTDNGTYRMYHYQDCCESVSIDDVNGDVSDLIGEVVTLAEENTNCDEPKPGEYSESFTWTFYRIATIKGYVVIRWLGESNGYYSESVDFERV